MSSIFYKKGDVETRSWYLIFTFQLQAVQLIDSDTLFRFRCETSFVLSCP